MVTSNVSDVVELEVRINARPETVFPFLTDPEKMIRWMGVSAELDPRPGGMYRVNVTGRDIAHGEYREVEPNSRVVFTWGWEGESHPPAPGASTVEISLAPEGDGTVLRLRYSGLSAEQGESHAHGWEHYLERIAIVAVGGDAGVDPWTNPEGSGG